MSKKKYLSLSDDERSILQFLWRVKVASTSVIFFRFEPDFKWKTFTAYERLSKLKKKGCVDTRSDESGNFRAWVLTAKGFKAIRQNLLALKEEGYASESITHDLHVTAIHYGEWIQKGSAPDVRFVTEQELRRIDSDDLPKWATPLQSHKPDGVWYFPETKAKTLVSLELELSRKRSDDYKSLGAFYSEQESICSVLWIVQKRSQASSIVNAFQAATITYRDIHNFVLLDDLKKSGWASVIFFGPNVGMSIHNFLESARRSQPIAMPLPSPGYGYVERMLNFHIKRFNSDTSASVKNSRFRA